jgi:prepilin-type N-terminal cleavage/methylation domain-containing protein
MNFPGSHGKVLPAGGFTLLELLVSAALIGVIMMIMLTATSTSMAIWRNSERAISVDREGRNAVALISDDMANMLGVSESAPDYLQPQIAVWKDLVFLEFFVLRPRDYQAEGNGNDGDLCYVRYRYRDRRIERAMVDSAETFAAIANSQRPATGEDDFEVLSENLPNFTVSTYDGQGNRLNPEGNSDDIKKVRFTGLSLGALDADEATNREKGVELRSTGTTSELLSSMQYFSTFFEIPRTP